MEKIEWLVSVNLSLLTVYLFFLILRVEIHFHPKAWVKKMIYRARAFFEKPPIEVRWEFQCPDCERNNKYVTSIGGVYDKTLTLFNDAYLSFYSKESEDELHLLKQLTMKLNNRIKEIEDGKDK